MKEKLTNIFNKDKSFYLNILKDQPNNYEAILKLGLIDVKESNLVSAKKKFKQLIKIDNKRYEAHLNLSNIISLEGDINKANHVLLNFLDNIEENIEIIIVDDGSTDGSSEKLKEIKGKKDYKYLYKHIKLDINSGKGKAIQTGIKNSDAIGTIH